MLQSIKPYIFWLYISLLVFHSFNKFLLRPLVIEHNINQFLEVFCYSVPNTIEAMVGSMIICGLLLFAKSKTRFMYSLNESMLHSIAVGLAAIYTISQELKLHSVGGANVFDINDVIASILGLIAIRYLFFQFGFSKTNKNN